MNPLLQKLLAAIGLQADATEDAALTAVAALKVRADELDQQLGAARTEVAALKAKTAGPDEQTLAAMRTLQTEVATLTGRLATRDLDDVIAAALAAGKLVPAQEKWARDLGARDLQALKSYIESAPAVAALSGHQSRGRAPAAGDDARAIAAKAQDYIAEQAKSGRVVGAVEAVRHVHQAA